MGKLLEFKRCFFKVGEVFNCGDWCWEKKAGKTPVLFEGNSLKTTCSKSKDNYFAAMKQVFKEF